ncbi:hypothetical protein BDR26DRAFT_1008252 [Obelidium mucronatum]|nr:hypothetical protein BDR26DRAFT_1008252 [Obelidium mucronatum]
MGVSRTLHFNQSWASDASAQIHDRLKTVYNAKNSNSAWSILCRLYLQQQQQQQQPNQSKSTKPKHLYVLNTTSSDTATPVAYSLIVDPNQNKRSFIKCSGGSELETIVSKLKTSWVSRQAIRIDGLEYRPPNCDFSIKVGTMTIGTMLKGVLLEITIENTQDESIAIPRIRTLLQKLFAEIPGYSSLSLVNLVPDTIDFGNAAWLQKEQSQDAQSSILDLSPAKPTGKQKMTRTIRQPYNTSHIPHVSLQERFARNFENGLMKPTFKKNGAGRGNWGSAIEVYDLYDGPREAGLTVQVVSHDVGSETKKSYSR